jgi:hypothetical protein
LSAVETHEKYNGRGREHRRFRHDDSRRKKNIILTADKEIEDIKHHGDGNENREQDQGPSVRGFSLSHRSVCPAFQ